MPTPPTTRRAACNCGQLSLTAEGDPVRISMCHCVECQRRTGAVLSNQARYPRERITVPPRMVEYDSVTSARIESEGLRAREVSRRSHDTPRLWSLPLRLPRPGRITSPYGGAREYNGKVASRHTGTDFAGAVGAPVVAPTGGVVALVADFYLAGKAVYLDHGAGLVTGYFHLSRADVAKGDTVKAGQRIGAVGRSGRVTGPHLHWIMRYGTISIDPMSLVELGKTPEDSSP